ncbi:MAG: zinc-dependent alcohol dehydrogenase family protein [Ectothiorhodospiraceae bacterium]|nr:zinc-dependent alcohol dehydrogenase family protein [Ectothiorhodospiraceae bacterium]
MIRARYERRGPVPQDVIETVEMDEPALTGEEVLLEVLSAPINPSDLLTLTGDYGVLPPLPSFAGNEGVGRVAKLGPEAGNAVRQGQTVLLPVGIGTGSSHVVARASRLVPLPENADPMQLSMITVNPPTASLLLSEFVHLEPGDWVIQNAANSGVGGYLVQLARNRGLRTVNVVRRKEVAEELKDMGADGVIVDGDALADHVREATGGADIRLAIDAVGGQATDHLADCLAEGGTLVNYGLMSGEACHISPKSLVFRDITVKGFWLARWFRAADRERQRALYGDLTRMIAGGELRARVDSSYDVSQVKQAVAAAAAGGRNGKVLIVPHHG